MSKIEQKLKENRNRRAREKLLSALGEDGKRVLSKVEFTSDVSCLKYAAFPTWDMESDCQTTTRGKIEGWENETFKHWDEAINHLKSINIASKIKGWFFIDTDGPFYLLEWKDIKSILDDVSTYAEYHEHYDFGWVGESIDCGVILEFEHTSFCRNEFEVSKWGI